MTDKFTYCLTYPSDGNIVLGKNSLENMCVGSRNTVIGENNAHDAINLNGCVLIGNDIPTPPRDGFTRIGNGEYYLQIDDAGCGTVVGGSVNAAVNAAIKAMVSAMATIINAPEVMPEIEAALAGGKAND